MLAVKRGGGAACTEAVYVYISSNSIELLHWDLMDYSLAVNRNLKMQHWTVYDSPEYYQNPPKCYQLHASFTEQPPEDLRKSNFFRFTVAFRDINNDPVEIVQARFGHYLNETHEADLRNGIKYFVKFRFTDGFVQERDLYLTLLDAAKLEPIRYEGQDDNPKMKRVLITHETICTRCIQQKSCGNKNEAPSDPLIVEKGCLKFFLKCNQNCLKGAGNPKDMRRFSLVLSFDDITHNRQGILAVSDKMFVHNNSKNGRKRRKGADLSSNAAKVLHFFPRQGPCGTPIAIYGENFVESTRVMMGGMEVAADIVSEKVIEARIPYAAIPRVGISLFIPERFVNIPVGFFEIQTKRDPVLAAVYPKVGVCGEEVLLISKEVATLPNLSVTCNGNRLHTRVVNSSAVVVTLPHQLMPGEVTLAVFWGSLPQFWFQYDIQNQVGAAFRRQLGQLFVCVNGRQSELGMVEPPDEIREGMIPTNSYFASSSSPSSSGSSHSPYTSSSFGPTSSPESVLHN